MRDSNILFCETHLDYILGGLVAQLHVRHIEEEVNIPNKILNIPPLTDMQAMPRSKDRNGGIPAYAARAEDFASSIVDSA